MNAVASPTSAAERRGPGTRRRALPVAAALAVALAGALPVRAVSEREFSLDDMVSLADDIVVGRVLHSTPRWQGKLIVTVSQVAVGESLKGRPVDEVEVTQLGGTAVHPRLGVPVTMSVSEDAVLSPGEEVVLFVRQTRPGTRQLVGGAQGKLVIRPDPTSGVPTLPGAPHRLLVEREGEHRRIETAAPTLDAMRRRIDAAVARQANTRGEVPR
ncbi:hypothetical protein L6Q96_17430 [Candidatus Binatia bacterium]|nr:hypothetical protein [Candidatus Binatia bacterium]